MKLYVANFKEGNGLTIVEGYRYIKNDNPVNEYDKYIGVYDKVIFKNEYNDQFILINTLYNGDHIPLIINYRLVKGKGAIIVGDKNEIKD